VKLMERHTKDVPRRRLPRPCYELLADFEIAELLRAFGSSSAPTDRTTKKTLRLLERLGNVLGADLTDLFMILNP
jgi:DNA repair protein RadC